MNAMPLQPDLFRQDFINKLYTQELKLKFGPVVYNDLNEDTIYLAIYTDLPSAPFFYDLVYAKLEYDMDDRVVDARFYTTNDDVEVCQPNAIAVLLSAKDKKHFANILTGTPL